jgi:hypothetical protein
MNLQRHMLHGAVALTAAFVTGLASAATMTFGTLPGANGANYTTYSEAGLTFAKTAGSGCVGTFFGNPVPSIFGGPTCDSGSTGSFKLTGGTFSLTSVDLAANNGLLTYSFVGKLGAATQWTQSSSLAGPNATFVTIPGAFAAAVDSVEFNFTTQGTSWNIDNIVVSSATAAIPVPPSLALMLAGLAGIAGVSTARRRKAA